MKEREGKNKLEIVVRVFHCDVVHARILSGKAVDGVHKAHWEQVEKVKQRRGSV